MTPDRRVVMAVAGVVAAVGLGVLVAGVLGGDGGGDAVSAGTSSTTSSTAPPDLVPESTTTTFDLMPEPTVPTTSGPASTTTTTAAPSPVVSAAGAVLRAPSGSGSATRKMTGEDCSTLAADGWSAECGIVVVKGGGRVVWLVESKPVSVGSPTRARRAYVLAPAPSGGWGGSGSWRVALEALDENGTRWKAVGVRALDVSEDGADEVVWGFRAAGSGGALAVDVVEGPAPGSVTAHVDLRQGSARVSTGQLDTWSHVSGSGSTARFQHDLIRWRDNAWRVVSRTQTAASDVPPSHF